MVRSPGPSNPWRLAVALSLAALLAVALLPAFAQNGPPAEPLIPNVEPAAGPGLADDGEIWTLDERAAVEATLAAYFASGQATPPDGALLGSADLAAMSDQQLAATYAVYLPLLRQPASLGQVTPTPAPPTATPTAVPGTPTPTATPQPSADVSVTLWPRPSIWVARGATLEYEIRLRNRGSAAATQTRVVIPFNATQVAVTGSSLNSGAGDWVSDATPGRFTVIFGRLEPGRTRTGRIVVRVGGGLAQGTILDVRASYSWRDGAGGGGQAANWTPVLVGSGPSDAPFIWVQITPDRGPAGTRYTFLTNRFLPGEPVSAWLNTPRGVQALGLRGTADGQGVVRLGYSSTGLPAGSYQMVLFGQRSGLTGVASFTVQ